MAVELFLNEEAHVDIADANDWYEARQVGLGEEFLRQIDAYIQGILRNPQLYGIIHEEYRRALVR